MSTCPKCGKDGSLFRSKKGILICILCIQDEFYGKNDWSSSSTDPISQALKRLQDDPIEDLLARRRKQYNAEQENK